MDGTYEKSFILVSLEFSLKYTSFKYYGRSLIFKVSDICSCLSKQCILYAVNMVAYVFSRKLSRLESKSKTIKRNIHVILIFLLLKGWIFNVVPWLISLPSTIFAGWFADKLIAKSIILD